MGVRETKGFGNLRRDLIIRFGPQIVLLLFPSLIAFAIIFSGEDMIVSDLAFIFGAILLLETVYFTFWGTKRRENVNDSITSDDYLSSETNRKDLEIRLECPQCNKKFYTIYTGTEKEFECNHCSYLGKIDDSDLLLNLSS